MFIHKSYRLRLTHKSYRLSYEYPRNEQTVDVVTGSRLVLVICAIYLSHMNHSGNVSNGHDEKQGHQQSLVDGRRQHSSEKNITECIDETHVHNGMKYDGQYNL